jgi:hypothetical protein
LLAVWIRQHLLLAFRLQHVHHRCISEPHSLLKLCWSLWARGCCVALWAQRECEAYSVHRGAITRPGRSASYLLSV